MASESQQDLPTTFSDLPPESFWVATDDEQDWFNTNAVMQRKTSLKLGFNRNFNSLPPNRKLSRQSVFGLPNVQKTGGVDRNPSEKKPGRSLFRSRSEPGAKAVLHVSEPGSPRVSCTGRVGFRSGGDDRKTGFTRIFGSLFRSNSGKSRSRRRGNNVGR